MKLPFQPFCRTQKYEIVQISGGGGDANEGKSGTVPSVVTYQGKNRREKGRKKNTE